ncbi:ABC transporter ATP-binding protein [Kiloniella sp. b19]|uniref:ABC transporter ATP-binding protein n=1 Tax=Kiloniella sp. GXU_MW_B19 TaxID=3141326 RepID=UPI0031E27335
MTQHGNEVPRLKLTGMTKRFPGCLANDSVDLEIAPGEIHALLGENGAGKSTLMKMVYGLLKADEGTLEWDGKPRDIVSPAMARELGIGMVFQHFSLFESLTVAENIALGLNSKEPLETLSKRIAEVSGHYGLPLDPARHVHSLSVGERQRIEIVRCLLQSPRLLIMDEPTSVLTPQEAETLFGTLRQLSAEGCSILYISHKLDEVRRLCARATVLRAGRCVGACIPAEETARSMAQMMISSELQAPERVQDKEIGDVRFQVDRLSLTTDDPFGVELSDINFSLHAGEILGVAGVAGNGQAELLSVLSGESTEARHGAIMIEGHKVGQLNARQRRDLGLAFVPEERLGRGAIPGMGLADNALLSGYARKSLVSWGIVSFSKARTYAENIIKDFNVVAGGTKAEAGSLSGGNLQKFIVGREILQKPRILIVAQPTWGVDAGAAAAIHQALINLAHEEKTAILVISQDLDELFAISDRLAVISHGRLSPAVATHEATVDEIGLRMGGLFEGEEQAHAAH